MRRTFSALCTACVAIIRSWIVSRTASAVATHQSRGVADAEWRASVETRWRLISERRTSTGLSFDTFGLWMVNGWKGAVLAPGKASSAAGLAARVMREALLRDTGGIGKGS